MGRGGGSLTDKCKKLRYGLGNADRPKGCVGQAEAKLGSRFFVFFLIVVDFLSLPA